MASITIKDDTANGASDQQAAAGCSRSGQQEPHQQRQSQQLTGDDQQAQNQPADRRKTRNRMTARNKAAQLEAQGEMIDLTEEETAQRTYLRRLDLTFNTDGIEQTLCEIYGGIYTQLSNDTLPNSKLVDALADIATVVEAKGSVQYFLERDCEWVKVMNRAIKNIQAEHAELKGVWEKWLKREEDEELFASTTLHRAGRRLRRATDQQTNREFLLEDVRDYLLKKTAQ